MDIGIKIKDCRESLGLTQEELGLLCGTSKQTIFKYEKGVVTNIPLDRLEKIADALHTTPAYLMGWEDAPRNITKGKLIPVLGCVRAGIPVEAVQEILDWEEIPDEMACCGEYFALRVSGDSMAPRFQEGDVVIVRKQECADTGDIVIALVDGNEGTLKKLKKGPDGIALIPLNPRYDVLHFSGREVSELPVQIIGKVVELRGKF